jgi:hypothetical protein
VSESSSSRPAAAGGAQGAIGRWPREGAGPHGPCGGRRPGHFGGGRSGGFKSQISAGVLIAALLAGAALVAACGGSPGGAPSPAASASVAPTPVPSPLITSGPAPAAAVDVVGEFWTLVGEGRLVEAKQSVVAPHSPIHGWSGEDIAAARFVRVVPHSVAGAPVEGATIEFSVIVWIDPGPKAGPWGAAGEHELFENVVRMSDGSWRLLESGTGP